MLALGLTVPCLPANAEALDPVIDLLPPAPVAYHPSNEPECADGNFMLAMNAHINRDFSFVLAGAGLTATDGTSHKPDHNAFNPRLDSLYKPGFTEEAERLDPTFDDINAGQLDDEGVGVIMRGWRETVWRNAEALSLAKSSLETSLAKARIETYATAQAVFYRALFASSPTQTTARDEYCRTRHSS